MRLECEVFTYVSRSYTSRCVPVEFDAFYQHFLLITIAFRQVPTNSNTFRLRGIHFCIKSLYVLKGPEQQSRSFGPISIITFWVDISYMCIAQMGASQKPPTPQTARLLISLNIIIEIGPKLCDCCSGLRGTYRFLIQCEYLSVGTFCDQQEMPV